MIVIRKFWSRTMRIREVVSLFKSYTGAAVFWCLLLSASFFMPPLFQNPLMSCPFPLLSCFCFWSGTGHIEICRRLFFTSLLESGHIWFILAAPIKIRAFLHIHDDFFPITLPSLLLSSCLLIFPSSPVAMTVGASRHSRNTITSVTDIISPILGSTSSCVLKAYVYMRIWSAKQLLSQV